MRILFSLEVTALKRNASVNRIFHLMCVGRVSAAARAIDGGSPVGVSQAGCQLILAQIVEFFTLVESTLLI
jgi:hypothetical protein